MPRSPTAAAPRDDAALSTFAWIWLALGALALVLIPPLRQHDATFGWLPFWCVVAPAFDLALLERRRWLHVSRDWLRRAAHRRGPARQARRHARRRRARLAPLLAALVNR